LIAGLRFAILVEAQQLGLYPFSAVVTLRAKHVACSFVLVLFLRFLACGVTMVEQFNSSVERFLSLAKDESNWEFSQEKRGVKVRTKKSKPPSCN
jgi:diacylglycerol kinase